MRILLALLLICCCRVRGQTTIIDTSNSLYTVTNEFGVQFNYWTHTNSVVVQSNCAIQILNYFTGICSNAAPGCVTCRLPGGSQSVYVWPANPGPYQATPPLPQFPIVLSGPLILEMNGCGMLTYKVTPKGDLTQPSTSVVIPSDATGPVEIVLESSADLVSWVAALPGTYGSTTTNRFFRVRAIKH